MKCLINPTGVLKEDSLLLPATVVLLSHGRTEKGSLIFPVNDILTTRQQSLSVGQCPPEKNQQRQCNSLVAFISLTASLLEKKQTQINPQTGH